MKFVIIEVEVKNYEGFAISEFDKSNYQEDNDVTIFGDPLSVSFNGEKLVLIFKGHEGKTKGIKISSIDF